MHMGGDVRESFTEWLDEYPMEDAPPDTPEARHLIGSVWTCTDILAGDYCSRLGIPRGSMYVQAARHLLAWHKGQERAAVDHP